MKKFFVLIAVITFLLIANYSPIKAQNTYTCDFDTSAPGGPTTTCIPVESTCDTANGFVIGNECDNPDLYGACFDADFYPCIEDPNALLKPHLCNNVGECIPCDNPEHMDCTYSNYNDCDSNCDLIAQTYYYCNEENLECNPQIGGGSGAWSTLTMCLTNTVCSGGSAESDFQYPNECSSQGGTGIGSAIGCIPLNNINPFTQTIVRWSLGVGGGIAFLSLIYAGFLYMTSHGDEDRTAQARTIASAAISGILFLVLSIYILRFLGNILINYGPFSI